MTTTPSRPRSGAITRRQFTLATSAALGLAAVGAPVRRARAAEPLKIGVVLPRSGYLAFFGQDCQRGAELAVPLLKEMGHDVELLSADAESSPDVGRTQAERLIREGAHVIVGAFDSGITAAVAQVCEQKGVPLIVNVGADPKITQQGYRTVFRNFPTSPMLGAQGFRLFNDLFAATGIRPKTAVMLHVNDTFGTGLAGAIKKLAPEVGLTFEVTEYISYDPKTRDLSVEVAKLRALKPDLVIPVTRLNDAILMVREMVKQRFEPMAIITPGGPGMYDEQFIKTLGKYAEYCISNAPWTDPGRPLTKRLEAAFAKAHPDLMFTGLNIGFTFEAMLIAADAHKRAGSTRPEALIAALKATNIEDRATVGGPIRFDETGQNTNLKIAALQIRDGRPQVVLPTEAAALKPVLPIPGWAARG